jgi:hypothetical protein
MQYSENYKFNLPDGTDDVDILELNSNFSNIDGLINEHQEQISALNQQVLVGGKGTLAFTVAHNTLRLDQLEENGGTGGVTPALYVKKATSETVGNITWHIEKWNDGYARCWGEYKLQSDINCNFDIDGKVYYGAVQIPLPEGVFTATPIFTTVTPKGLYFVRATVGAVISDPDAVVIAVFNESCGTDKETTIPSHASLSFCIELRGDGSLG